MRMIESRRRCELALLGAAICAMGIVIAKPVLAADLDVGPEYPGGYQEPPYPPPYPPHSQAYPPPYEGQYYGPPPYAYRPHAWAEPDDSYYRDEPYGYGRPRYFYYPYADRPPAPIPHGYAGDPRALPPDVLAEQGPLHGWRHGLPPDW
jgi:hypothetical protein